MEHARHLKRTCANRNAEWGELSNAMVELADAVEALPAHDHDEAIQEHLVPLAGEMSELLRNLRSKLVFDVCEQLARIVKTTRLAFVPLANAMLNGFADTAKGSSIATRDPGFRLFSDVSEYARYDLETIRRMYFASPHERVHKLLLGQLHVVFTYWSKDEIAPFYSAVVEILGRGMRDPNVGVRAACRDAFCSFSDLWMERAEELADIPTPQARDILIKEKPHAAISKAMQKKFNIGISKPVRSDGISAIRQQHKRQGSAATRGGDGVFIEVTESPRRPLPGSTADVPKRGVSPGRNTARAASPSVSSRGTSSSRAASPSATGRAVPPGTTARGASPRGISPGATATRHASPGRVAPRGNGNASPPPPTSRGRSSEFDRYRDMMKLEQNTNDAAVVNEPRGRVPTTPPREKMENRASIADTSTADPTRKLSFTSTHSSNTIQARETSNHQAAVPSSASARVPAPQFDQSNYVSARPAVSFSPSVTTGYAAAAQSFVMRDQSGESKMSVPPYVHPAANDLHMPNHPLTNGQLPRPRGPTTPPSRGQSTPATSTGMAPRMAHPDSYLDRPIPSSAPAPEPRASTNVTTRGRRPSQETRFVSNNEYQLSPPPVAVAPVPDAKREVEVRPSIIHRPSFLDDPAPPFVSIDSVFTMASTSDPTADGYSADLCGGAQSVNDENCNKENVDVGENKSNQERGKMDARKPTMDAISGLGALLGNTRALNEGYKTAKNAPPIKAPHGTALQVERIEKNEPVKPAQPAQPVSPRQDRHQVVADSKASVPADTREHPVAGHVHQGAIRPPAVDISRPVKMPVAAAQTKPQAHHEPSAPRQATSKSTGAQSTAVQLGPEPSSASTQQAQPAQQKLKSPPKRVDAETKLQQPKPAPDFVRTPAPFKFAPPQPPQPQQQRLQHQRPSPPARFPAAAAPGVFERNGLKVRHSEPNQQLPPQQPMPEASMERTEGLRQRYPQPHRESAQQEMDKSDASRENQVAKRPTVLNLQPQRAPSSIATKMLLSFCLVLAAIFGLSGVIQAATILRDSYEYHQSLVDRVHEFEIGISEAYDSVRKMDEKYTVWTEYVRELTEQDESNALHQLESIQVEVEKWQQEMKSDLLEFKKSLSGDILDAALAPLRESSSKDVGDATPEPAKT